MKTRAVILVLSVCLSISTCANRAAEDCADSWTPRAVPRSFPTGTGVNIHFIVPSPGEIKMIADAGFRWVRTDFKWESTETQRGVYDFSSYERLVTALNEQGIRALFILDYGNPLYTADRSIRSEEARQAFARWAVAAANRFQGRGVIWELFNEPDIDIFWPPKPNVNEYIALGETVGRLWRAQVPNEILIGPATSAIDFPFVTECLKAGLLKYWSAVSVHPYRKGEPESVATDYCRLRKLIQSYSGGSLDQIPIVSGEWGYSSLARWMTETDQAQLLSRQLLTNAANGIPISIWYDWRDDGADANEPEHHFGIVRHEYRAGAPQVFDPKPAYRAAAATNNFLAAAVFEKRLAMGASSDFVLVFSSAGHQRIVAWTTNSSSKQITIPMNGRFRMLDYAGVDMGEVSSSASGIPLRLTTAPLYLVPVN